MATWYVRPGGSDLNSGSTNSDAADQSGSNGAVVTATLTEVGAFAAAAATGAINLQDAGNSLIRTYTKVNNDSITLDSAPTSGNGTYAWKIGGARTSIKKVCTTGTGNNAKLAAGDFVGIKGGTYTENAISLAAQALNLYSSDGVEVVIDGTGGGAGSDCIVPGANSAWIGIACVNAVDQGFTVGSTGNIFQKCRAQSCGGIGMVPNTGTVYNLCRSSSNSAGWSGAIGGLYAFMCQGNDNTGDGWFSNSGSGGAKFVGCIFSGNGGQGIEYTSDDAISVFVNNTLVENTSDGLLLGSVNGLYDNALITNNIFANNGGYGVNSSAGAQAEGYWADYNVYYANNGGGTGLARNNFNTNSHDVTTDPKFTSLSGDDYSIMSTGSAYKTGYSPFKNPTLNTLNIGAVPGPGSAEIYIYTSPQSGGFRRF